MDYVAQLRAVRSAEFQRQVASVLPAAPLGEAARRHGGALRDLFVDWVGRLGGSDAVPYAAHTAASGIGRGAGGVLAVKIVAVLVGGAALVGGTVELFDQPDKPAPQERPAPPRPTPTPKPKPTPRATPRPTVTATPKRAKQSKPSHKSTQGGNGASDHEAAVTSNAPAGSPPNGAGEFTPDSANLPQAAPAAAPSAPGSSEFP